MSCTRVGPPFCCNLTEAAQRWGETWKVGESPADERACGADAARMESRLSVEYGKPHTAQHWRCAARDPSRPQHSRRT